MGKNRIKAKDDWGEKLKIHTMHKGLHSLPSFKKFLQIVNEKNNNPIKMETVSTHTFTEHLLLATPWVGAQHTSQ